MVSEFQKSEKKLCYRGESLEVSVRGLCCGLLDRESSCLVAEGGMELCQA